MSDFTHTDDLRGELSLNESMSRHTTWRVGGMAQQFYKPADVDDLMLFLKLLPKHEPLTWIGLGSNLLVRDAGIKGTVIFTSGRLNEIRKVGKRSLYVESGVPCAKVAKYCSKNGMSSGEFFAGIPGTIGGALAMNAGAFGSETWPLVQCVKTINRYGQCQQRWPEEYGVGYRSISGPADEWFVGAQLVFDGDESGESSTKIKELLKLRNETQPTGKNSCGSVFKNPDGDYAGRLIEECNLKGMCIGGAYVSDEHANFIINKGSATANDIEMLISYVISTVEHNFSITLEPEVRIIGEKL